MILQSLKRRARGVRLELISVALAARHPRTPWYAKLVAAGCVAYALTPVDLVPDALPVLGFIDDLLFIPLALGLARRFVPASVLAECRARAAAVELRLPRLGRVAWTMIGLAWAGSVALTAWWTVA